MKSPLIKSRLILLNKHQFNNSLAANKRIMTSSHEIETKTYTQTTGNGNSYTNGYTNSYTNGQNNGQQLNGRVSCAVSRSVNWFYNQSAIDIAASKVCNSIVQVHWKKFDRWRSFLIEGFAKLLRHSIFIIKHLFYF